MYQVVGSEGKARVDEMYEAENEERKRDVTIDTMGQGRGGGEQRWRYLMPKQRRLCLRLLVWGRAYSCRAGLGSWATASFRRRSVDKQLPVDRFRNLSFRSSYSSLTSIEAMDMDPKIVV